MEEVGRINFDPQYSRLLANLHPIRFFFYANDRIWRIPLRNSVLLSQDEYQKNE
jgi:hypothetical protein